MIYLIYLSHFELILDPMILDSVILDPVILNPAFPWNQITPDIYLITIVLIVVVVLCYFSNKRGPEQAQPQVVKFIEFPDTFSRNR